MDSFCCMYVDTTLSEKDFLMLLSDFMEGDLVIYLDKNEEYNQQSNDFLHFKYRLDIDFLNETVNYVSIVGAILLFLWSNQIPAVAACDYEDNLPENGGYKNGLSMTNAQLIKKPLK